MIENQLISDFYRSQFEYPINWLQFHRYKKANLIGKIRTNADGEVCLKSGRIANQVPKLKCFENERKLKQRYGIYGPNCYLYFYYIKRFALFMVIFSLFFGSSLLYLNAAVKCKQCFSDNLAYKISLFNSIDSIEGLRAQAFLWLIASVLIQAFLLWIRIKTYKKYDDVNERNITQSDYSIILRRVPYEAKISDIQALISSDIRRDIKNLISKNQYLLQKIKVKKKMSLSKKFSKQCLSPKKQRDKNIKKDKQINRKVNQLIKIKDIFWLHNMQETSKDFKKELERFRQSIKLGSQKEFVIKNISQPQIYSDTLLVIFHRIQTRRFIHQITKRTVFDEILNYFFPFISPLTQYTILDRKISIYGAPQPSDILWNNIGHTNKQRIKRKLLSFLGLVLLIGISGTIQYYLTIVKRNISNDILGIVFSLLIVVSNSVIQALSLWTVKQQKLDTRTNLQSEIMMLYVFHQTINTGFFILIIPLITKLPNLKVAILEANFPIIFLQTICILFGFIFFLTYFVEYFEIMTKIKIWLVKKGWIIKTQSEVNCEFKGPSIMFSKKYSNLIKIFWFGLIFGVISPLCIFISTFGILLVIPFQKALWNNKHSIPQYTGIRINQTLFTILDWTVFQIGVFNFLINYIMSIVKKRQMDKTIVTVTIFNVILGIAILIFPYRLVLYRYGIHVNDKVLQNIDYNQAQKQFEQTYKTTNPKSSKRMTPIVNQKIINPQKNKKLDRFQSLEQYRFQTFGKSLQHLVSQSERKFLLRKAQTMYQNRLD